MAAPASIQVLSEERIFPFSRPPTPQAVSLSIIDAKVAQFGPSAGVFFFSAASTAPSHTVTAFEFPSLRHSFQVALSDWPQWAGRVYATPDPSHATTNPASPPTLSPSSSSSSSSSLELRQQIIASLPPHARRPRRVVLTYGELSDPGALFATAIHHQPLSSIVPSPTERAAMREGWDASSTDMESFLPKMDVWFSDGMTESNTNKLGLGAQVTQLRCGGLAIGMKMAHCLADAASLVNFVKRWAEVHRVYLAGHSAVAKSDLSVFPTQLPRPIFDPQLLDAAARGDNDAELSDPVLVAQARQMPQHRHDWWISGGEGCPPAMRAGTDVPPGFTGGPIGDKIPWSEWDLDLEVAHRLVHFSAAELEGIWKAASGETSEGEKPRSRISRHDALLAFMWMLINRARGFEGDQGIVHMNMTLGLRARLLLPDEFVGSPILLTRISAVGGEVVDISRLGETAKQCRDTLSLFDKNALGAMLHELIFQESPQRVWNAFLGKRDIIVTSWARLGSYDISFETNHKSPWFVGAVMPGVDGILEIMEAAKVTAETGSGNSGESDGASAWYSDGVDVDLNFEKGVMERLVSDKMLRAFAVG